MNSLHNDSRQFFIDSIEIKNYRGIRDAHIWLGKVNVLVGVNGSGKSSLLQAVAMYLRYLIAPLNLKDDQELGPSQFDFRQGENRLIVELAFKEYGENDVSLVSDLNFALESYPEAVVEDRDAVPGGEWQLHGNKVSLPDQAFITTYAVERRLEVDSGEDKILDLFAFYPVNRFVGSVSLDSQIDDPSRNSRLAGYDGALTARTNFSSLFRWFRTEEDIENEKRLNEDPSFRNKHLEVIRRAVTQTLEGYTNIRVQRSPLLAMVMLKRGETMAIEQMSDGEKSVITIVGDLARRACILNPQLENPLDTPGLVMIDEIEQHLHPQWQRKIVQILPKVFPNIQFIFTTHSPIVCNSVGPDQLLVIKDGEVRSATAYGWSSKDVLKEIFEIDERPAEINEKLKQLDDAIDEANLVLAKELVSELSKNLPLQDPELVRAKVIIPMLEIEAMDERS